MLIFAVIALLVGSFMIYNTFSITVAQRSREDRSAPAVGASRRQVSRCVRGSAGRPGRADRRCGSGHRCRGDGKALLGAPGPRSRRGASWSAAGRWSPRHCRGGGHRGRRRRFRPQGGGWLPSKPFEKPASMALARPHAAGSSSASGCWAWARPRCSPGCSATVATLPLVGLGVLLIFLGVFGLNRTMARPLSGLLEALLPLLRACPASWRGRMPCATRSEPRPLRRR